MNFDSNILIFNVGRGLSILILTPLKHGLLIDLGSSDDFSPLEFIKQNLLEKIAKYNDQNFGQILITHPHADHISDIQSLSDFSYSLITCPHNKSEEEKFDFSVLESHKNLDTYLKLINHRNLPLQTIQYSSRYTSPINAEYGIYYIRPPKIKSSIFENDNFKYTNASSIVFYFKYGNNSILIPGDQLPESFEYLLDKTDGVEKRYSILSYEGKFKDWHYKTSDQPSLKSVLLESGLSVLIAPHHGLESGFSTRLYECIKDNKPNIVIISEKRHLNDSDGSIDSRYQSCNGSKGHSAIIDGVHTENNYSLTTRNNHHFLVKFTSTNSMKIFGDTDPKKLINLL
ncbi:MAG: MBL fold metallo-hydrolase [Candidatus Hodarchaeales archaeon]